MSLLAGPAQPEKYGDVLQMGADLFSGPLNALCITLYNEEVEVLANTLISVIGSLSKLHSAASHRNGFSTICIIVDGLSTLAPGMLEAFSSWGLFSKGQRADKDGVETHASLHDSAILLPRVCGTTIPTPTCHSTRVRIVLCLKSANQGKLHSHKHFFSTLCTRFSPRYCYQVDAGSILHVDTVPLLVQRMESDSAIGAIAPRVLPPVPSSEDAFLAHWQFFDFAFRASTSWPFEVVTGHLSVLPGQVSIVRWDALQGCAMTVPDGGVSPLKSYLYGMDELSSIDRVRYLAEDRVIGVSLMLAERLNWRLDYLPEAKGTTDPCETFAELMRQRRRWNNSSLATRIWLLQQLPAFARRRDRTWRNKVAFSVAVCSQAILACREFFAPAILAALLITLVQAQERLPMPAGALIKTYLAVVCIDLLSMLLPQFEPSRHRLRSLIRQMRRVLYVVSPALFICVVLAFQWPVTVILLFPALTLVAAALVGPRRGLMAIARNQFSPIPALAFFCALSLYAFTRLDDVSWGTKGLTKVALGISIRTGLARLRNTALACWLPANAILIFVAAETMRVNTWSISGVTLVSCVVDGFLAMIALGFLHRRKQRGKARDESHDDAGGPRPSS